MGVIRYMDFDVEVVPDDGGYRTRVRKAPAGDGASSLFRPLDEAVLKELLGLVAHPDAVRIHDEPPEAVAERVKSFGAVLYESLFAGEVGTSLRDSRRESARRAMGLRLRLRLASDLADVPWEYLYHEALDRFLCLSVETPVVRYLEVPEPVRVVSVKPPLRILVMVSDPIDYPRLDVEGEIDRLHEALREPIRRGLVQLDRLDDATMVELHNRLLDNEYHVFHYIGHGGFDTEHRDGVLVLEGPGGAPALTPGDDLGTVLHDHRPLRLAVLNSCEGARGSPKDPFAGTAQGLIQQGVPAVIAMQFPISDVAAKTFSQQLYSTIARGYPVDAALGEARKSVYLTGHRLEWATPVLYLRSPNGRIFNIEGAAPVEVRVAEGDPLAPADGEADVVQPTAIVAEGKVLHVEGPHGALITAAAPGERPEPRPRRPPLDLRPKDFPDLLGREAEVRTVTATFLADGETATEPVEIFGHAGSGKTSLVRNVAHHPSAQFPDGVVYSASRQSAADLLRFLFQTFYETPEPLMPTEADLRHFLHDVRALVLLDDVALSREELGMLTNVAPSCLFLFCSETQVLWEEGPAVAVRGLAEPAALALLERRLGRSIAAEELPAARALVGAVRGLPLPLVQAASRIRTDGLQLGQVVGEVVARAAEELPSVGPPSLTEPEARVAAVLAAVGAPVDAALLALATGLPDAQPVADSLKDRGEAQSHSPRYSLAVPPSLERRAALEAGPWPDRALEALTVWAEEPPFRPGRILQEADALLGILRWGVEHERWPAVVRLGRAIERAFAIGARWARWEEVLVLVRGAAQTLGDRGQEAWAMHQLGTRHVGRDQIAEGRDLLLRALEGRVEIGDLEGAEVTRRNLEFAGGAPPRPHPGDGGGPTPPPPPRIWFGVIVVLAVIAAGIFAAWRLLPDDDGDVVPDPGEAGFDVDPGALEFADQVVETEGESLTVTISSTGDRTLELGAASVDPRDDFVLQSDTCSGIELPRGSECTITVAFRPAAEGERRGVLSIDHSAEGSPLVIELTGVGTGADGETAPVLLPDIAVDPEGALTFTSPQEQQTVTVLSTGEAPLELDVTLDELEAVSQYSIETDCTELAPLEPGETCSITVTFLGNPEVDSSATLLVSNNATPEPIAIPLTGVPTPEISVGAFAFDDADGRWEAVATVSNIGTAAFEVLGAMTTDESIFQVVDRPCGIVGIGGSCAITVAVVTDQCSDDPFTALLVITDSTVEGRHDAGLEFSRTCPD